jgi:hypothetical protein
MHIVSALFLCLSFSLVVEPVTGTRNDIQFYRARRYFRRWRFSTTVRYPEKES